MKKMKKILSALLTAAMMASLVTVALAAETQTSQSSTMVGKGTYASPANANVWEIQLPTESQVAFTIDPLKLVKASGRYGEEVTVADKTFLFPTYNDEGALASFSDESGDIKVVNRGSTNVTVELNVRPTDTTMVVREAAADTADTKASIGFQVKAGSSGTYTYVPIVGANYSVDIDKKAEGWTAQYNGEDYVYVRSEASQDESFAWNDAVFKIKGDANANTSVNWNDPDLTAPDLKLTWNIRNKDAEAIQISLDAALNTTDFKSAADCLYALPGQVVNVYVYPVQNDADGKLKVVATGPTTITTSVKDYNTGVITDADATSITFGSGVASDNGATVYSFTVPPKAGMVGFTATKKDGSTANTIAISGAPTVKTLTVTGAYA